MSKDAHSVRDLLTFWLRPESRKKLLSFLSDTKSLYDLIAWFGSLFAVSVAVPASVSTSSLGFFGPLFRQFPIRLILFLVMAACLGWTLAALSSFVSRRMSEWTTMVSHFAAIVWATVLVALVHGLFGPGPGHTDTVYEVLLVFGICLAVFFMATEYQLFQTSDVRALEFKSSIVAVFAASTLVVSLLVQVAE